MNNTIIPYRSSEADHQQINVPFDFSVFFTRRVFDVDNCVLRRLLAPQNQTNPIPKVCAWFDEGLLEAQPDLTAQIMDYFHQYLPEYHLDQPAVYPGGEEVKDGWKYVNHMLSDLQHKRLCRHSYVLTIGGGAFLDASGLAAALFHRGIRLIRMPSTVLSQDDSGIGIKNGINWRGYKNFLGTFSPPFAVINDLDLLKTLPLDIMRDGLAEAFKVAIIKDRAFFDFLSEKAAQLKVGSPEVLHTVVKRCAELHMEHIASSGDPFEMGNSRPLDFGHWSAHRLESMSGYSVRHGQAVAIGIALDTLYACKLGLISSADLALVLDALEAVGLPTYHPLLSVRSANASHLILQGLEDFREHLGGILCVTLPNPLGDKIEVAEIDQNLMIECIDWLSQRAGCPNKVLAYETPL